MDEATGLYFPDYQKIAEAFRIPYIKISDPSELNEKIGKTMSSEGPLFCDVELIENQKIVPMLKFGSGLDDLDPKIPSETIAEIKKNAMGILHETANL